jgi:ribosomal protein S12 methylthiotransferase
MKNIYLLTLGCPKNLVDSENLLKRLVSTGITYKDNPAQADTIIVNTCGFIEEAKRESVEQILRLASIKGDGKKLLVYGCLAKRYRDELIKEIPEIDAIFGVGEDNEIIKYLKINRFGGLTTSFDKLNAKRPHTMTPSLNPYPYAYLKVSEGCSRGCTYCVIPSIRGPLKSRNPDEILKEAESYIRAGKKELIIIGQDITSYGLDINKGYGLPLLLKDISSISGDFWIRLLYLHPSGVDDSLIEIINIEEKICKYLDIPIQHSEKRILKAMGRGGSKEYLREVFKRIRDTNKDITLRTTVMVGFPGEREEDFRGLLDFIKAVGFERLGVFTYSREEGTPSYSMKEQIPKRIKEERRRKVLALQSEISLNSNRMLIGKHLRAIVDDVDSSYAMARIYSQAPEIDGVLFLSTGSFGKNGGEINPKDPVERGDFLDVKITNAYDYDLEGRVIG